MPRVKALGSERMKAAAAAREAAGRTVMTPDAMKGRIKGMQAILGYKSLEEMCNDLHINEYRVRYIMKHPETCTISEAALLHTMARSVNVRIFDTVDFAEQEGRTTCSF